MCEGGAEAPEQRKPDYYRTLEVTFGVRARRLPVTRRRRLPGSPAPADA